MLKSTNTVSLFTMVASNDLAPGPTNVPKSTFLSLICPDKARAQLKKDEAQALKAKRDLERIRPLYAQNAASQLDLDYAQAAYETAEASSFFNCARALSAFARYWS